jgi:hypothetical protein
MENISVRNNRTDSNLSPLPYEHFHNMSIVVKLSTQPCLVGTGKRPLALFISTKLVKLLNIDPPTILFLVKVAGPDELWSRIISQEQPEKIAPVVTGAKQEVGHQ